MKTKDITIIGILTAMSVVIAIIESYFTFALDFIPGLKLGLANIVIIFALYKYNFKTALIISLVRVFIVALVRTGFGLNFFFSLSGAIFSIIAMTLARKTKLSIIGISVIGSISHSIGQVLIGMFLLNNSNVIYYLPYLLLFSIPTGIIIGIITKKLLDGTKKLIK
ncbi:MAG: Gx transporter family protein [Bacilli bacterium]